jgi:putative nucleotidyltransferase with HDIG domain
MPRFSYMLAPLRLLTWPMRHIRWKIILPYVLLSALLAIIASYLTIQLVTGSLGERFDNRLLEAGRVTADAVVRKERDHLETVRAVAFTKGVADSIQSGDGDEVGDLVQPIAGNAGVERLEILDSQGRRLKTLALSDSVGLHYKELSDDDEPAEWPLVGRVLQGDDQLGDKYAQIIETSEGFVLYTAGPIFDNDELVGAVLVGTTLDSFVRQTKTEAMADITIYDFNGHPLASTFVQASDASGDEARLDIGVDWLRATVQGSSAIREHRTLWGRGYDLVYGRLEVRDQVIGLYSVGLSTDFLSGAGATTRLQMIFVFGTGMAATLVIGFLLARLLTRPLLRLVRAARLVTAGDLTARSGVRSGDEIGTLASSFDEMTEKLQRQHLATVRALASAIDARDPYTLGHSARVAQLAVMLGRHLGFDEKTLAQIEIGGYLHDIGKIGIRDAVLLKPDQLSTEERRAITEHPQIGLAMLEPVDFPSEVLDFVRSHHERLDGSGYPDGLTGEQISIIARIAAVADVYDALTSSRPYRRALSSEEALALLRSQAGRRLDARVCEALASVALEWERRQATERGLCHSDRLESPSLEQVKVTV